VAVAARTLAAPTLPLRRGTRRRPAARPHTVSRTRRPQARGRRIPFAVLSLLAATAMVILLTGVQALVSQGAFRLSDLSERAERLQVERDLLRLRVARMSSPDRVARAGRRVGLVLPIQVEVLPSPTRGPASPTRGPALASAPPDS
jgi:hypothetical protein